MKFSNVVRMQPKEGEFDNVVAIASEPMDAEGILQNIIIKTSDKTLCFIGVWESEEHIAKARPKMIAQLDKVRDKLEVLSEELGVTDPVSGPIIFEH